MLNLKDPSLLRQDAYVNGQWIGADSRFAVVNPVNGEAIAHVADLTIAAVSAAIDAADAAKKSWAAQTGKERSAILRQWHALMLENADDLAAILTAEMGKPLAEARGEIVYGASFIEWFAEEAKRVYGETIPGHQRDKRIVVLRQPVGVVGSITPWNFPNAMIARKVAPALAVGCTFVARPAELTPLSALAMAELAHRAGVPAGVFNVITTLDASATGKELCANTKVRKITFTGSTRVGKILMQQCADTVKKVSLELGGNAPFIVFDDADIDAAVEGAMIAKYRNAGQTCVCTNRFYVQAAVHDEFVTKLTQRVEALKIGDGMTDGVQIGPMINAAGLSKVERHLEDAREKGAQVVIGGGRHELGGHFYQPTVLTGMKPEMLISHEETFGPLSPVYAFDSEEEVIALANDTEFGLAGYFYANDINRIWRVAEAMETGMVGINTGLISTEVAPFGGVKQSGLGREGFRHGIDEFLEMKYMCFGEVK